MPGNLSGRYLVNTVNPIRQMCKGFFVCDVIYHSNTLKYTNKTFPKVIPSKPMEFSIKLHKIK